MQFNTQDALPSTTATLTTSSCGWCLPNDYYYHEFCFKTAVHELELSAIMEMNDSGKSINKLQSYGSKKYDSMPSSALTKQALLLGTWGNLQESFLHQKMVIRKK